MIKQQLLDTNIIIRFFTGDPPAQAQRAYSLIAAADSGQLTLVVLPVIVAETVFSLQSFYKMKPGDIASRLMIFVQSQGILAQEKNRILNALELYGERKAGFVDAYLAAASIEENIPIVSIDRDFDKIGNVIRIAPKEN